MSARPQATLATPVPTQPQAAPAAAPRPAVAGGTLVESLKSTATQGIGQLLERMFRGADEALLQLTDGSADAQERRRGLDLAAALRMEQARVQRALLHIVERSFDPLAPAPGVSGRGSEDPEEQVALTNLATRAKKLHRDALASLQRRLEQAAQRQGIAVSPQALAPARLCDALRATLAPLDLDLASRLLVYQLFDRTVIAGLAPVYAALGELLDRHGVEAPPAAVPTEAAAPLAVDGRTLACLERIATGGTRGSNADTLLALELQRATRGRGTASAAALTQRLSLVGQMFNQIVADPHLPAELGTPLEHLRYAALKTALADARFFQSEQHPVRRLLHEAALQAVCSRVAGDGAVREIAQRLRELPAQFEVGAAQVLPLLNAIASLDGPTTQRFLDGQRAESGARREALLARVRGAVAQELEVQTLGAHLPAAAPPLLRAGFGPLLAVRLLRHGINSRLWHDAVDRLARVLRLLQPVLPTEERLQTREELLLAFTADLHDIGMPEERIAHVVQGLRAAFSSADHEARQAALAEQRPVADLSTAELLALLDDFADGAAPAAPAVVAGDPLARILVPQHWLRVALDEEGETRWLRVESYYPRHDSVGLSDFDRNRSYKLSAKRLRQDLEAGRCEPINPSADMAHALAELRMRAAA